MRRDLRSATKTATRGMPSTGPLLADLRDDQHVNERIIAQVTGLSLSWVRKQRSLRQGPPWTKFGKAVRYPVRGLREWLQKASESTANCDDEPRA